ncbi:SigE family RNA polymerase sigma factor [Frankia sp. CNm7]|uniref:SigE family RNA polymerase sigma factor n=1 Tax=Frankia nepalensis TaxID=1836974 RepID=A0A937UPD9_9ACTN|nr:SigE family RNA polymerase sigma factor [Frankia nepalensis]MBL7502586.1 SigE family RNA polymerase sigma factor [Frankia nepalensis]MBL7514741.1 SigE family RNA polymerase sigma factor [Frankia nepalensis]MBL7523004.1 SigE family RNA polymerase sigma factor [Frankia nepalensis]MBL7628978.1 SigE family RNA polymerase sigma factor [Frankia nepalensis]
MRADDERAFEEFMARTASRQLLSAVLLTGGDWAAAEDLVQGAFERTYLHWGKIDAGREDAYLRRTVINAATSRWRRLRARVREVPLLVDGEWTVDVPEADADHAARMTQRDGLIRALRTLPPRQRAIVVLRYVDDLPESDVAAALGCSVGSVRSQASRGLAKLRHSEHLRVLGPAAAAGPHPGTTGRRRGAKPGPAVDILTNEPGSQAVARAVTAPRTREDTP